MKRKSSKSRVAGRSAKRAPKRSTKRAAPRRTPSPDVPPPSPLIPPSRPSPTVAPAAISRAAAAAAAFEPGPFSEPIPLGEEDTPQDKLSALLKPTYEAPYGHMRNGKVYPDPFPFEPPSQQESLALKLSPVQRIALEQILLGAQLSVAARCAGVTRMTLYRWLYHDPNFQAAYNTWKADAMINSRTRILAMANTATSTLECAVQVNPRIALAVLKASGVLKPATIEPTEPEECRRQIDRQQQKSQQLQPSLAEPLSPPEPASDELTLGPSTPTESAASEIMAASSKPPVSTPPESIWEPAGLSPATNAPQYLGSTPPAATNPPVTI